VETPRVRRPNRRKSQFPEDDGDDSSSATDSASVKVEARKPPSRSTSMAKEATTNGHAVTNGSSVNGYSAMNGSSTNGHAATNGSAKPNGESKGVVDGWAPGMDPKIDYSPHFDFGGSFGVSAMMTCFPLLMYYMWIGASFYDGKFPTPQAGQSYTDFFKHMGNLVYEYAFPSFYAWKIYWIFFVSEGVMYCLLPGYTTYGKPLPWDGGKQLKYHCSGVWAFYTTIIVTGALHLTGLFPLYTIIDEFGPLMSVAICSGFLVSFVAYFSALARGAQHRMTGYPIYDFFMGAELNPRMFGILDFKMFFEVRLPWYILLATSCATAARQYENYGYVSGEVLFLVMAHFLYANACSKGEECIPTTWFVPTLPFGILHIMITLLGIFTMRNGVLCSSFGTSLVFPSAIAIAASSSPTI
jgi:Delta24(24(1))-sterol reductase